MKKKNLEMKRKGGAGEQGDEMQLIPVGAATTAFTVAVRKTFFGAASLLNPLIFISYVLICFAWSLISDLFDAAQINWYVTPVCNETRHDVLEGPRQWQKKTSN